MRTAMITPLLSGGGRAYHNPGGLFAVLGEKLGEKGSLRRMEEPWRSIRKVEDVED